MKTTGHIRAQDKSVQKKWGLLDFKETHNKRSKEEFTEREARWRSKEQGGGKVEARWRKGGGKVEKGGGKVEEDNLEDDRNLLMKSWSLASYS